MAENPKKRDSAPKAKVENKIKSEKYSAKTTSERFGAGKDKVTIKKKSKDLAQNKKGPVFDVNRNKGLQEFKGKVHTDSKSGRPIGITSGSGKFTRLTGGKNSPGTQKALQKLAKEKTLHDRKKARFETMRSNFATAKPAKEV